MPLALAVRDRPSPDGFCVFRHEFHHGDLAIPALFAFPIPIVACLASLVPANAVVSRWFVRRLGLALGLTALGQGLPGVILPPIIAAVLPSLGWRMIWRIGGIVIGLVILPIVVWVLRDRPTEAKVRTI